MPPRCSPTQPGGSQSSHTNCAHHPPHTNQHHLLQHLQQGWPPSLPPSTPILPHLRPTRPSPAQGSTLPVATNSSSHGPVESVVVVPTIRLSRSTYSHLVSFQVYSLCKSPVSCRQYASRYFSVKYGCMPWGYTHTGSRCPVLLLTGCAELSSPRGSCPPSLLAAAWLPQRTYPFTWPLGSAGCFSPITFLAPAECHRGAPCPGPANGLQTFLGQRRRRRNVWVEEDALR